MPLAALMLENNIRITHASKNEFKLHQRSGDVEKAKHLSSDAVLARPLPDSNISTQIRDLRNVSNCIIVFI